MAIIVDEGSETGYIDEATGEPANGPNINTSTAYTPSGAVVSNNTSGGGVNLSQQFTTDAGDTYGIDSKGNHVRIPAGGDMTDAVVVPSSEYASASGGVAKSTSSPGGTGTASSTGYGAPPTSPNLLTQMQNLLKGGGLGTAGGVAALTALSKALGGGLVNPGGTTGVHRGYQGGIPELTANRTMNKIPADYRPGGGGMTYFSPLTFTNPAGKVVSGVGGSGSPMSVGDATGNVTGSTMAGALTPTNTNIPGGITNVGDTTGLAKQLAEQRAAIDAANKAATDAANKNAADKLAADKLAADKLAADKRATEKTAADALAAETARKGTQTALGNIVAKYPNSTKDPHQMAQMQVELANYMDTHGVKAADLPSILKGASYGQDWTPDVINSTYKSVDPLAQVIAAYNDKTKTPAQVAALAAQNNITTQQLQNYGVDTASLNNLATQGYLSTPLLADTLKQDYNAGTPAGIASINSILASNPSLTTAKIQEMFPGIDLYALNQQGIKLPGYTDPTKTLQDLYDKKDITGINNLLKTQNINSGDLTGMFKGIDLHAMADQGISIPGFDDPIAKASMQQAMGALTQQNYPSTSSTPSNMASVFTQGMANNGIVPSAGGIGSIAGNTGAASTPAAATPAAIKPAAPAYTNYSTTDMGNYFAQNGIDVGNAAQVAAAVQATNADPGAVNNFIASNYAPSTGDAAGGIIKSHYAMGGFAPGGISGLGSYSDGGRMLKGPGDGVSDSIPAVIGGHQKAALADGEFVVPARIVSEIGNGSSDAGARKLYAMMDRIQNARKKTTKNVAANTRAEKYLPA